MCGGGVKKGQNSVHVVVECSPSSIFFSFFGRIEDTINCFRDLLTFSVHCNALVYCGLSLNCARAGFAVKARHIFKELIKNVQNVKFDKKEKNPKL